jgi:tight adherence protein C
MTLTLLFGAVFGLGLWCIVRGLFPPRPSLAATLAVLVGPPSLEATSLTTPAPAVPEGQWLSRAGRPLASQLARRGAPLLPTGVRHNLAVLERSPERHLAEKVGAALVGFLLLPAMTALCVMAGVDIPVAVPLGGAFLVAAGGFLLPDHAVHCEAAKRRCEFRQALSAFVDLAAIAVAGGSGVEGALVDAAGIRDGWAFARLRRALETARITRTAPWTALQQLGTELDIAELEELAASVSLAGTEGATVRRSLAARAATLRCHLLSGSEAAAQGATEAMSLPVVLLFFGFLLFIAFPALARVMVGL